MAAASADLGGLFAEGQGHEIAQGYGSFLWAGVVLYGMVAWRVWARRPEAGRPRHPSGQARRFSGPISCRRPVLGHASRHDQEIFGIS